MILPKGIDNSTFLRLFPEHPDKINFLPFLALKKIDLDISCSLKR